MKRTDIKTITYDVGFRNFMVDVVETEYGHEAFLYKSNYGVKDLMFGLQEKDIDAFVEIVEANLPDYMYSYEEEYCD